MKPMDTIRAALSVFEDKIRDYDYLDALGDYEAAERMRRQRLSEIRAAREWLRAER